MELLGKKKKLWWSRVDGNRLGWKVETSVGQFSFFCENSLVPILTLCYEKLIGYLIYIIYIWVGEN